MCLPNRYFMILIKLLLFVCFLHLSVLTYSQNNRELFRGGMLLHTGYMSNKLEDPSVDGIVTGIGGKITFRLGDHFRLGTEGYVSNYAYPNNEGQHKLGWGGILTEYQFSDKRLAPVIGLTVGGGKVHDLYMLSGNFDDNNPDESIYKVYSALVLTPNFSLEYRISESINFVGKIDYVMYPVIEYSKFIAKGPRFYFGVLFMR